VTDVTGPQARQPGRVVAVVVTFDRRALLTRSLDAVLAQTRPPDCVVVVDNASTDGTADAVRAGYPGVELHELAFNAGGAGGFAFGLGVALEQHRADHVWLLDDDTIPTETALAELLDAWARLPGQAPALVASRVVWTDGRDHPMNTPRRAPLARRRHRAAAAAVESSPVRSASFVSILVDGAAARRTAPPVADYFLWNDDFEYTTRLLRERPGLASRRSVVVHHTRVFGSTDADPGARFYFEVRNKLWLFTRSSGLGPLERGLYAGSTLLRWVRTVARSADRATLLRAAARGGRDALRAGPRPNAEVLAGARA
jgi:GT2 family glycosyltransferase